MAIHLALEELALPHRIAAFEGSVVLKDFGDASPVPRALIAGLQGVTCSQLFAHIRYPRDQAMFRLMLDITTFGGRTCGCCPCS
jgi:hypothetical protein